MDYSFKTCFSVSRFLMPAVFASLLAFSSATAKDRLCSIFFFNCDSISVRFLYHSEDK